MAANGGLVAARGGTRERGGDAVCRDVLGVAQEQRGERGVGVRARKAAAGELVGRHVVEAHHEVGRHDGGGVVASLLGCIDARVAGAKGVEQRLEHGDGRVVALEREPCAPQLLPALNLLLTA